MLVKCSESPFFLSFRTSFSADPESSAKQMLKALNIFYLLLNSLYLGIQRFIDGRPGGEDEIFGVLPSIPKKLRLFWCADFALIGRR